MGFKNLGFMFLKTNYTLHIGEMEAIFTARQIEFLGHNFVSSLRTLKP